MSFDREREMLIKSLVRRGYISKIEVIRAMEEVPRHLFVPSHLINRAYDDTPLEIGEGQTISAPHMVGIMVENLDLEVGNKVLEIGTGSGYHSAIVAKIVGEEGHVYTIERFESLASKAKIALKDAGITSNVTVVVGDGSKGLAEHAPYDRIYVTCASPGIPKPLIEQLKDGGKLLIPVGSMYAQELVSCIKKGDKVSKKNLGGCVFVPLTGEYGFR